MDITYENDKVKKQCTNIKKAKQDFSEVDAKKLHQKINFIESAETLADIQAYTPMNFHNLKDSRKGEYAIDINGRKSSYRLILKFKGYENTEIFGNAKSITVVQIKEVSKHYE